MPVDSKRRDFLKKWRRFIKRHSYMRHLKETRVSYQLLCKTISTIEAKRYLNRSFNGKTTYKAVSSLKIVHFMESLSDKGFKECFRLSRDELRDLNKAVGQHPVFHNERGRPQRHPIIQLAVFLYRLGSANRLSDIARALGGLSIGTIINYTNRSLVAINAIYRDRVAWPDQDRRSEMDVWHHVEHQLPGCIGYLDGTHILLRKCPSFSPEKNSTFFTRKKRYALLVLAACDETKRFIYLQVGHYGAAHDSRAQKSTNIHKSPERLFDNEQYLLADSGFMSTTNVVSMFKRKARSELEPLEAEFNDHAARTRVKIEHAFGVLKQRFRMLSDLHITLKTDDDLVLARLLIRAAVILHNMFIKTAESYWDEAAFNRAKNATENDETLRINLAERDANPTAERERRRDHERRARLARAVHILLEAQAHL